MDVGTVKKNLKNNKYKYVEEGRFFKSIIIIFK